MKFIGSKQRLSGRIIPLIHKAIAEEQTGLYVEPFVGGANIIDKVIAPCKIGADNDKYLIELLNAAKRGEEIPDTITREEYEAVRGNMSAYPEWYVGLVGFCASYNAKFFGGLCKRGTHQNRHRQKLHRRGNPKLKKASTKPLQHGPSLLRLQAVERAERRNHLLRPSLCGSNRVQWAAF